MLHTCTSPLITLSLIGSINDLNIPFDRGAKLGNIISYTSIILIVKDGMNLTAVSFNFFVFGISLNTEFT